MPLSLFAGCPRPPTRKSLRPSHRECIPLLATLGSAIGMSRVVRLKQGRTESAAIYAAIVALPGTKKTPAFKWAAGPAHEK
jgi:hypothetical protein